MMNCLITSSRLMRRSCRCGLRRLQRYVLVGRCVGEERDQAEPGFPNTCADTVDESQLPDRGINRPLDHQLLNLEEDCLALPAIELYRLLVIQLVDVWVAAVGE